MLSPKRGMLIGDREGIVGKLVPRPDEGASWPEGVVGRGGIATELTETADAAGPGGRGDPPSRSRSIDERREADRPGGWRS